MREVARFVSEQLAPMENVLSTGTHFILKKYKDNSVEFDPADSDKREVMVMVNYEQILSARVKEVQPSGIRRFFELAAKMPHAISLGVGEPDFETPWQIRRAGIQSLEKGQTFYTSNWGLAELRNQIAALVRRKYRLCYDADKEILVTVGGSEAIDNTIRADCQRGGRGAHSGAEFCMLQAADADGGRCSGAAADPRRRTSSS